MREQPFQHDERYTQFVPRVGVEAPPRSGQIAYFIEPGFETGGRKVWFGFKKGNPIPIIVDREA